MCQSIWLRRFARLRLRITGFAFSYAAQSRQDGLRGLGVLFDLGDQGIEAFEALFVSDSFYKAKADGLAVDITVEIE